MVVCHCEVVNDRTIAEAIQAGALDADDLAAICGAGARCGGCRPTIESLLVRIRLAEQPAA